MKNWLKKLFCIHNWVFRYELECILPGGLYVEEVHKCSKCGKLRAKVKK